MGHMRHWVCIHDCFIWRHDIYNGDGGGHIPNLKPFPRYERENSDFFPFFFYSEHLLAVQRSFPGEFKIDRNGLNLAWPFVYENPYRKPEKVQPHSKHPTCSLS